MSTEPGRLTLPEEDRRILAAWAAECAERTLPLFEAVAPHDRRPRDAVDGLRKFALGELRIGPLRSLAAAAHAAAREVSDPAAVAAARAAGHAAATAHMAAHARGVPAYGAIAAGLSATRDPDAAQAALRWAVDRASPEVRGVLRRLPPPPSGGELGALIRQLHAAVIEPD